MQEKELKLLLDKKEQCFGCEACVGACPVPCISMLTDDEGFRYAYIETEKCTDCGKCRNVCPSLVQPEFEKHPQPAVMAACNNNEEIRSKSSSGGTFTSLAKQILERDGIVCGAAFKDGAIKHIICKTEEEVTALRGSKYTQSRIDDGYQEICKYLENERPVLFTGTPCQVAGLRNRVDGSHPLLYTCDLVCFGVPSPKILSLYLKQREAEAGHKVTNIHFRDKANGWKTPCVRLDFEDGTSRTATHNNDPFMIGFHQSLHLRPSCHSCPFASTPRYGDITLGDFWGLAAEAEAKLGGDKGISLLLINTEKGNELLQSCQTEITTMERELTEAVRANPQLQHSHPPSKKRDDFFRCLKNNPYDKAEHRFLRPAGRLEKVRRSIAIQLRSFRTSPHEFVRKKIRKITATGETTKTGDKLTVGINTFHYGINYGGNLQAYALCEYLNTHGCNAKLVDYRAAPPPANLMQSLLKLHPYAFIRDLKELRFARFRKKHMPMTSRRYTSSEEIHSDPPVFDACICGSDQIWNPSILQGRLDSVYFLDYAPKGAKRISYAASFGGELPQELRTIATELLSKIDHVSVREKDGADLVKELTGKEPDLTVDPVMLLSSYEKLMQPESSAKNDYIFFYRLDFKEDTEKAVKLACEILGKRLITVSIPWYSGDIGHLACPGPGGWLKLIRDAACVVSNSFHATIFSILFHKNFIVLPLKGDMADRNNRLTSLLETLGLSERMLLDESENSLKKTLNSDISWEQVDERLAQQREASEKFLLSSLGIS